jgi:N-acetylmuramoyl-L-alanine amidase
VSKVFLNPGHWPFPGEPGFDPGAVNNDLVQNGHPLYEGDLARVMAQKLATKLRELGHEVLVFGAPTLQGICDKANGWNADLFVSMHLNACDKKSRGVEVYTYRQCSTESDMLAKSVYAAIQNSEKAFKRTPWYWRGNLKAGFYVIKHTNMPAVLVEMGFIDNDDEAKEMLTLTWQSAMADGMAAGIDAYTKG